MSKDELLLRFLEICFSWLFYVICLLIFLICFFTLYNLKESSEEMGRAACVIQAAWRAHQTRKRLKKLPRAVSTIQRSFRWRDDLLSSIFSNSTTLFKTHIYQFVCTWPPYGPYSQIVASPHPIFISAYYKFKFLQIVVFSSQTKWAINIDDIVHYTDFNPIRCSLKRQDYDMSKGCWTKWHDSNLCLSCWFVREKRRRQQEDAERRRAEEELRHQVCLRRQRAMRQFRQRQLHLMEILPAGNTHTHSFKPNSCV